MADRELKPKSFRIDEETAEKFKEISNNIGGSQQETLAKLIEAYEFQSGKAILTEKKADIEQFEKYVTVLTRMFMGCLEDNQNATETVRTEFDALLKSKDTVIRDLQEKLNTEKQLKEEATRKSKTYADENDRLNGLINSMKNETDNIKSMLSDKDDLNKALKEKIKNMEKDAGQSAILRKELERLKKEHEESVRKQADLENQIHQEQTRHEKDVSELKNHEADALERQKEKLQIAKDKAVLEVEKSYQEQIHQLKADNQAEINTYQQNYYALLEQMKGQMAAIE